MKEKRLFMDDNHNYVPKDEARWLVIHNYDDSGKLIEEEWVDLKK